MNPIAISRPYRNLSVGAAQGFGLKARYTHHQNCPSLGDHIFLVDRYSPKRLLVQDYYNRLPKDRLSWRIITNISHKSVPKAVLRNRLRRRWASAFTEALKKAGYAHDGHKIVEGQKVKTGEGGLRGSLEVLVYSDRGLDCPHWQLTGACKQLVKAIESKMVRMEAKDAAISPEKEDNEALKETTSILGDVTSSLWAFWKKI
jgi:ribonuclease P protein component